MVSSLLVSRKSRLVWSPLVALGAKRCRDDRRRADGPLMLPGTRTSMSAQLNPRRAYQRSKPRPRQRSVFTMTSSVVCRLSPSGAAVLYFYFLAMTLARATERGLPRSFCPYPYPCPYLLAPPPPPKKLAILFLASTGLPPLNLLAALGLLLAGTACFLAAGG